MRCEVVERRSCGDHPHGGRLPLFGKMVSMPGHYVARSRTTTLGIALLFGLLGLCAQVPTWQSHVSILTRSLVAVALGGITTFFIVRALRVSIIANESGLTIRNHLSTKKLRWVEILRLECGRSTNVTGLVSTVLVTPARGGRPIPSAGASSYSKAKVERWTEALRSKAPAEWSGGIQGMP